MIDALKRAIDDVRDGRRGVLVIQTAFIGDVILATPIFAGIRREFPEARITALVVPQATEIVAGWSDSVIPFDKRHANSEDWRMLRKQLAHEDFAMAIIPHRSFRSGRLAREAGIYVRIGFDRGGGRYLHSVPVTYERTLYEGARNSHLLEPIIDKDLDPLPELKISSEVNRKVDAIVESLSLGKGGFFVFAPASVWQTKAWPMEYYRVLAERVGREYGLQCIAIGGAGETAVCEASILDPTMNLAGKLSLLESAALMNHAKVIISGDSAAAHLATAVRVKQAIIFGSTAPRFGFLPPTIDARPFGVDLWCRPCTDHGRRHCPINRHPVCLQGISPEMVLEGIKDWLTSN